MSKHRCGSCNEKDPTKFYKDRRKGPDGLQTYCKVCAKKRREDWAEENEERIESYYKKRYKALRRDKEKWEAQLRKNAEYRKHKRYHSQIAWNNYRAKTEYRREERITTKEWLALLNEHPEKCPGCKQGWNICGSATIDHIKPLALKGTNSIENIQPLCRSCNAEKSARVMRFIKRKMESAKCQESK